MADAKIDVTGVLPDRPPTETRTFIDEDVVEQVAEQRRQRRRRGPGPSEEVGDE